MTSLTLVLIFLHHLQDKVRPTNGVNLTDMIYSDEFGTMSFNLDIPDRVPVLDAIFRQQPFEPEAHDESLQTMYARYEDIEKQFPESLRGEALIPFIY